MESDDNDETPTDLNLRRPASPAARALANLSFQLSALAATIGTSARNLDTFDRPQRLGILAGLAPQLGELGDECHNARRLIEDMSKETP
jgi:hypothetical protein